MLGQYGGRKTPQQQHQPVARRPHLVYPHKPVVGGENLLKVFQADALVAYLLSTRQVKARRPVVVGHLLHKNSRDIMGQSVYVASRDDSESQRKS